MKFLLPFVLCGSLLNNHYSLAQTGLWLVNSVQVGEKNLTPVGKWFDIKENGRYNSGNGWIRNSAGTWSMSRDDKLTMKEEVATSEGNLPFEVALKGDMMTWQRDEFGQMVTVRLERTEDLPRTPTDSIQALWKVLSVIKDDVDITSEYDPEKKRTIYMRPDRTFNDDNGPEGRVRGYWHMNMHFSMLTIIQTSATEGKEQWLISFRDNRMVWKGQSDSNKSMTIEYERLASFPE